MKDNQMSRTTITHTRVVHPIMNNKIRKSNYNTRHHKEDGEEEAETEQ